MLKSFSTCQKNCKDNKCIVHAEILISINDDIIYGNNRKSKYHMKFNELLNL